MRVIEPTPTDAGAGDGAPASSDADSPGGRSSVEPAAAQRLVATFIHADDPAVGAVVDQLSAEDDQRVATLMDVVLSDPDRLQALHDSGLMDGLPNVALDQIARMTTDALGTSLASVTLVGQDRQFLAGCNVPETGFPRSRPLTLSFSKFVVASGRTLIVHDATRHRLFAQHPAVQGGVVVAFVGVPLIDSQGHTIGTLSTWDDHPRHWTTGQIQILTDLAQVAATKVFR